MQNKSVMRSVPDPLSRVEGLAPRLHIHTVDFNTISNQDQHINERPPTTPDYESVEFVHGSAVHITNPAYSNDVELVSPVSKTAASSVYNDDGQSTGTFPTNYTDQTWHW